MHHETVLASHFYFIPVGYAQDLLFPVFVGGFLFNCELIQAYEGKKCGWEGFNECLSLDTKRNFFAKLFKLLEASLKLCNV
jgi:hypothetical protein